MFEFLEGTGIRRYFMNTGFPFILATGNGKYIPNWSRIIEALLIAMVTAFLASQLTIAKLEVKIDYAQGERVRLQQQIDENRKCLMELMKEVGNNHR